MDSTWGLVPSYLDSFSGWTLPRQLWLTCRHAETTNIPVAPKGGATRRREGAGGPGGGGKEGRDGGREQVAETWGEER